MPLVTTCWVDADGSCQQRTGPDLEAPPDNAKWVWTDVADPDEGVLATLRDRYSLHSLAIEDALHAQTRPKLDLYDAAIFLVWLTPEHPTGDGITSRELDVFVGTGFLITVHKGSNEVIDAIKSDLSSTMRTGPDWVLHAILDRLVDHTMPLIDAIGEQLLTIEDAMLAESPRQDDLLRLHRVRRQLTRLHRIVAPERDILRGMQRESAFVGADAYRYLQDIGDHLARALDSIETYQDVGASVMDVYLSAQNNRMNEIMKQLTVVATIFMPLTLISGIYGMNVLVGMWPPPLAPWSFALVVGSMVVIATVMALYFRKKKWW